MNRNLYIPFSIIALIFTNSTTFAQTTKPAVIPGEVCETQPSDVEKVLSQKIVLSPTFNLDLGIDPRDKADSILNGIHLVSQETGKEVKIGIRGYFDKDLKVLLSVSPIEPLLPNQIYSLVIEPKAASIKSSLAPYSHSFSTMSAADSAAALKKDPKSSVITFVSDSDGGAKENVKQTPQEPKTVLLPWEGTFLSADANALTNLEYLKPSISLNQTLAADIKSLQYPKVIPVNSHLKLFQVVIEKSPEGEIQKFEEVPLALTYPIQNNSNDGFYFVSRPKQRLKPNSLYVLATDFDLKTIPPTANEKSVAKLTPFRTLSAEESAKAEKAKAENEVFIFSPNDLPVIEANPPAK